MLFHDGQTLCVETLASGAASGLSGSIEGEYIDSDPLYGVYPAQNAVSCDRESITVSIPAAQTAGSDGYDTAAAVSAARTLSGSLTFRAVGGGIDFWGNCWEWTSSIAESGEYIIKGGSWDSDRDDCRSEKSDVVRGGSQGYANVGFRVVRVGL